MPLGENLEIALAVKKIDETFAFFQQIGFIQFGDSHDESYRWKMVADGNIYVGLHEYDEPSPLLMYFTNHFEEKTAVVEKLGLPLVNKMEMEGKPIMIAVEDPNGQRLGITDLMGMELEVPEIEKVSLLGDFGEYSIPTKDMEASEKWWREIGFEGEIFEEPYRWGILSDGLIPIGLHETDEFSEPALTYFSGDMKDKLKVLQEKGLAFPWKQEDADDIKNAHIETPEGQRFFLFDGEI
jgi:predicted lactoylglutathione lyase